MNWKFWKRKIQNPAEAPTPKEEVLVLPAENRVEAKPEPRNPEAERIRQSLLAARRK